MKRTNHQRTEIFNIKRVDIKVKHQSNNVKIIEIEN